VTTSTYNGIACTGYIYTERDTTNFPDTTNNGRVLLNNVHLEDTAILQGKDTNAIQLQLGGTTGGNGLTLAGNAGVASISTGTVFLGNLLTEATGPQTLSILGPNTGILTMLGTMPKNLTIEMTGNILRVQTDPTAGLTGSEKGTFNLNATTSGALELRANMDGASATGWGSQMVVNVSNGRLIKGYVNEVAGGTVPPHGTRIVNLFNGVVNGILSIGSSRTPTGAAGNVLYNVGPQPGVINHTTTGGDLRIVTGGQGVPGTNLTSATTINLGNNRVIMGYVDEVGGTTNLKLVGTLTNVNVNATNTGGTNLTSAPGLTLQAVLNGRTVTFNAGTANQVDVDPGAGNLVVNAATLLCRSDMLNTSVTVNSGGTFDIDAPRTVGSFIYNSGAVFNYQANGANTLTVTNRLGGNGTLVNADAAQIPVQPFSSVAPGPDTKTTGTLTYGTPLSTLVTFTVPNSFTYDWKFKAAGSDRVAVNGAFEYVAVMGVPPTLNVMPLDGSAPAASYTILTWTGAVAGGSVDAGSLAGTDVSLPVASQGSVVLPAGSGVGAGAGLPAADGVSQVPEPATLVLLAIGGLGLGGYVCRRRARAARP